VAITDKNILITPNIGQAAEPKIDFVGASATLGPQTITLNVYPENNGTISFEGSAGQLFSVTNDLTGTIFSVNDVSGIPSIEVLASGVVRLAEYSGNVLVGTATDNGTDKLQVSGDVLASTFKGALSGNATTATTLQTTRAINGTNFDGSAAITTANWGTARTLTIGSTGKSVNGSGNVAWSLTEIGAPSTTGVGASGTWGIAITGNAATATTLQTTRAINGTNFNGSAAITTANWGTARTISIGGTGKSVNGSANITWATSEIAAQTAVTFSTTRANYKGVTDGAVAGQLMWKNYGNNHTIFDASNGTSPTGTTVNSTNAAVAWVATYPTLMGWNGSTTYGVRVDSARITDSAAKWTTARTLTLAGDLTGSVAFDGSANFTLTAAVVDNSHNHSNYVLKAGDTMTGTLTNSNATSSPKLDFTGQPGAASFNFLLRGYNDTGAKGVHYINGSTRTADGGANTYTIRNDGGSMRLGTTTYTTLIEGSVVGINTDNFSYTQSDNTHLVGTVTANKLFVNGSVQLLSNNDAFVVGRGTGSFFKDEELGFGWGGGWYMTETTLLRVRNNKNVYSTGDARFSLFYDSGNTGYYLDPASTSNLNGLTVTTINRNPMLTLAGDATGSTTFTNLGNATLTLSVVDDSHNHTFINSAVVTDTPDSALQYFQSSGNTNINPTTDWYNTIRMGHGDPVTYYSNTLAIGMTANPGSIWTRTIAAGVAGSWRRFFADDYHPNADTWTTARTNTVTLTGDVTGTASASVNGSANWGVSITTVIADDSHSHAFNNLTAKTGGTGTYTTSGDFRAPIFYDSNNTAYYADLATNTTSVNQLGNTVYNSIGRGPTGLYNAARLQLLFSMGAAYQLPADGSTSGNLYGVAWSHPNAGTIGGANNLASHGMLMIENGVFKGAWGGGSLRSPTDVRAPVFYDYNNTAYYTDQASTSNLNSLNVVTINRNPVLTLTGDATGSATFTNLGNATLTVAIVDNSHNHSNYLPLAGGTMTGLLVGRNSASTDVNTANDTGSFSVRGSTTTVAAMSFHRAGAYAINMGLGNDNVFRIGGWSASVNAFQMTGGGALTMLADVTAFSDIRLKNNIKTIPDALTKILNSRGVNFTRTDQEDRERVQIGVIAQEIEKYFPEVVLEDASGIKSVNYGAMAGAFIEAIKELNTKIERLEKLVDDLLTNK
jgi:hypothetical protein